MPADFFVYTHSTAPAMLRAAYKILLHLDYCMRQMPDCCLLCSGNFCPCKQCRFCSARSWLSCLCRFGEITLLRSWSYLRSSSLFFWIKKPHCFCPVFGRRGNSISSVWLFADRKRPQCLAEKRQCFARKKIWTGARGKSFDLVNCHLFVKNGTGIPAPCEKLIVNVD